jgi:tetratricopeptide (TPR) repeat protein
MADYTRAISLAPTYAPAYYHRGNLKYWHRSLYSAVADFSTAIKLDPTDDVAIADRGFALLMMGKTKAALCDANELVRLRPNWVRYSTRALFRWADGDRQGALDDYSTAIFLNPFDDHAYRGRGVGRLENGDYVGGLTDYLRAVRLNPSTLQTDFRLSPLGRWLYAQ